MTGLVAGSKDKTKNSALFDNLILKSLKGDNPRPADFSEKIVPLYKQNAK
jgi:hypothetical protein